MVIIEDTRQQAGKHDLKHRWFKENGVEIVRSKCLVGDYTLPDNQTICIDTKKDMQEIYSNIIQQHKRFTEELKLAQKCNINLIILVENDVNIRSVDDVAGWQNPRLKEWYLIRAMQKKGKWLSRKISKQPPCDGKRLCKAMQTMEERYGVQFLFCTPQESGKRIISILQGKNF